MYIFDNKRVNHTFEIKNAIRVSTCSDGWGNADSYSVSQSETDGTITINTLAGLVTYDQNSNRLVFDGAHIAK